MANARKQQALDLKMGGMTYEAIAAEMGYANRSSAWVAVKSAQRTQLAETTEAYRHLELARLDALQAAVWDAAVDGDAVAVQAALRVVEARCRLLRLFDHEPPELGDGGLHTVVQPNTRDSSG